MIPNLNLVPPVSGYNVTVKVWPLGFREFAPDVEAVRQAVADVRANDTERVSALYQLMKVLSNDNRTE